MDSESDFAILETIWQDVTAQFLRNGHEEPARAALVLDEAMHDSCRHFAGTTPDGKSVRVAPILIDMPADTVIAILAHEGGHVVDLSNPGRWWFRNGKLALVEELPTRGLKKLLSAWRDRSDDELERVADAIAESVLGMRIGYVGTGSCLVEALGRGRPRPKGLR